MCSGDNPSGACNIGDTCLEGSCVATADLCSAANPDGVCPSGQVCADGMCSTSELAGCEEQVYTEQPEIVVVASADAPLTVITINEDTPEEEDICVPITDERVELEGLVWEGASRGTLTVDGLTFKDSNGNGELDAYEDWRLREICRAQDLVSKMTLDQKIGQMGEGSRFGSSGEDFDCASGAEEQLVATNRLDDLVETHRRPALIRVGQSAREYAIYLNNLNEVAEGLPLGVPVVITTDPSHGLRMESSESCGRRCTQPGPQNVSGNDSFADFPSEWGFGAINNQNLTREAGDIIRKEFMAMGFRWQLGPMADSATEPRWARNQSTFGENSVTAAIHTRAWVSGMQNYGCEEEQCLRNGIAATMKHFPGAGPNQDGMDSHSYDGRFNIFPGNNFQQHLMPFQAAVDVGVAAVMPCYSVYKREINGVLTPIEEDPYQVPAGFSPALMTDILKTQMGFTGMATGDWGTSGDPYGNNAGLTTAQRAANWLKAGSHQWGSDDVNYFRDALDQGYIDESHIDEAVGKILEMSFKLGLFENPYVDEDEAAQIVRSQEHMLFGFNAQKRAIVMLENEGDVLPIVGDADDNDSNGDGTVQVFLDGVHDSDGDTGGGLVSSPIIDPDDGSVSYYDPYVKDDSDADFLGEYDYTLEAGAENLAVVEVSSLDEADIAILRIGSRRGQYFGLDAGVPLSFDGPFPGNDNDGGLEVALGERNQVVDLFRVRDGYMGCNLAGDALEAVPAANPDLKIVLVVYADRQPIVKAFVDGLMPEALNDVMDGGECVSYQDYYDGSSADRALTSNVDNHDPDGESGVDALLIDFGAYDRAVLDVLFDVNLPEEADWNYLDARLPFEIPSTDAAVDAQFEDVPGDSANPQYILGEGDDY